MDYSQAGYVDLVLLYLPNGERNDSVDWHCSIEFLGMGIVALYALVHHWCVDAHIPICTCLL